MASFEARDRFLQAAPQRLDWALAALGIDHDVKVYPDARRAKRRAATAVRLSVGLEQL